MFLSWILRSLAVLTWKAYDPKWLVDLAVRQRPDEEWLHQALKSCTRYRPGGSHMIYFVEPCNANEPGGWQFEKNVLLDSEIEGDIILDVLKDGRIGGVEFLGRMLREIR